MSAENGNIGQGDVSKIPVADRSLQRSAFVTDRQDEATTHQTVPSCVSVSYA